MPNKLKLLLFLFFEKKTFFVTYPVLAIPIKQNSTVQ